MSYHLPELLQTKSVRIFIHIFKSLKRFLWVSLVENIIVKLIIFTVFSLLRTILREKANAVERTKIQNQGTLKNINKYREFNTSASYIMLLTIAFATFINTKIFLINFNKLVTFPRKRCCLAWAHKICICFQQWQYLFSGENPNCQSINNVEIWALSWPRESEHHLQKPVINKFLVCVGSDTRFKQAKHLLR